MNIAACEICGRILRFVPIEPDEKTCTPEGAGYMECAKCGQQTTWRIIEKRLRQPKEET